MRFPAISLSAARTHLDTRPKGKSGDPKGSYEIGSGDDARPLLAEAAKVLSDSVAKYSEKGTGKEMGPAFDAEAAAALHNALDLPRRVAGDSDFWRYFVCVDLYDVVQWRHPPRSEDPYSGNPFGLGNVWEILPRRLWARGELGYQAGSEDPYRLVRRGSVDFWASGPIRHLYGCARPVVRALVRYQYPEDGTFEGKRYRPRTLNIDEYRELIKKIRHYHATTTLEFLDDSQANELIKRLAKDCKLPESKAEDETWA